MSSLMENLRNNPPVSLGSIEIEEFKDYNTGVVCEGLTLPESNVLQYSLKDGSLVTVRPSGTEPKIKFYISCCENAESGLDKAKEIAGRKVSDIKQDIEKIISEL